MLDIKQSDKFHVESHPEIIEPIKPERKVKKVKKFRDEDHMTHDEFMLKHKGLSKRPDSKKETKVDENINIRE